MTIRTAKMLTARDDLIPNSTVLWWPANEGAGNSAIDRIHGIPITDSTTAGHNEPHAMTLYSGASTKLGTGIASVQIPRSFLLLAVQKVGISGALTQLLMGKQGQDETGLLLSGAAASVKAGATDSTSIALSTGSAGAGVVISGALLVDGYTVTAYSGANSAFAADGTPATLNATTAAALPRAFTDGLNLNSVGQSHFYGAALFDFTNEVPDDVLAGIQWMQAAWLRGDKRLYPGWL